MTSAALPETRGVARALQRRPGRDVVGVAGVGGDREVRALGQPGQRADQVGRQFAVGAGVEQHLLHVPVGVVVGEDRVVEVLVAAGGLQVAGRGADRVDRVVGVFAPVAVGVDAVHFPARRQELHPADGAGAGDVEVGAEPGLDFVDRGQHLPGDPVFGSAGLVDRQQEGRDLEGVDDEVGDADRRRPEGGDRGRRVGEGGGAAGAELGAAVAAVGQGLVAAAGRARGLDAAAGPPPPLESPRSSLWVTPSVVVAGIAAVDRGALLDAAALLTPSGAVLRWRGVVPRGRGPEWRGAAPLGATVASLVPVGSVQSGSARSIRPSASSSRPLAQAGACSEGTAVVVVAAEGSVGALSASGSAPAIPTPRADSARKLASATSQCDLGSHPNMASVPAATDGGNWIRTLPMPQARPRYPFAQGHATAVAVPQHGLNQH